MKKYQVKLTLSASHDITDIYDYLCYSLCEPAAADRIFVKLEDAVTSLRELPERHGVIPERPYDKIGMRRFNVGNYTVFYTVGDNEVTVTHPV